ncbi:MAG: MerR family transcriptional regulator [Alphaproteobacteria bacterium]|nr:MAG: MerR family transcriptional regulator [Alphaproteobacteria bacterium]
MVPADSDGGADREKSDRAFRTISEAAETIGVPQHVLRFWETRFPQLQPLKRGGNRRYYRPADMALLATIKAMLHDEGLTIRGAQLALGGSKERTRPAPVRTVAEASPIAAEVPEFVPAPVAAFVPSSATAPGPILDLAALRDIRDRLRHALAA